MLELAAVLAAGNMIISVVNSRSVYYEPYAELMSHEGYVFTPQNLNSYSEDMEQKKFYNSLQGDIDVTYAYVRQLMTSSDILKNDMYDEEIKYRNLICFENKILSKMNTPLASGKWPSSQRNSQGQIEAVAVMNREKHLKVGDVIPFGLPDVKQGTKDITSVEMGELVIVGIVDSNQYYPNHIMEGTVQGSNGRKNTRDVRNMYSVSSSGIDDAEFIISAQADDRLRDDRYIGSSTAFITYRSSPTDAIRNTNKELLTGQRGTFISMTDFKNSSDSYLYEQYIRLLPILLGVFIIVLAELICSVALHTKEQMRNYGIYFLCGARFRSCLRISLAYALIILAGGAVIGSCAFLIFQTTSYAQMFEQNIGLNNLLITLSFIPVMLIISLVIPFFMLQKTSPVEIIKSE